MGEGGIVVESGKQVALELVVHDTKSMTGRVMRDRISHRAPDHEVVPRHKERLSFYGRLADKCYKRLSCGD
jgi:hypothetical protein